MMPPAALLRAPLFLALLLGPARSAAAEPPAPAVRAVQSAIAARVEKLLAEQTLVVGGDRISTTLILPDLYQRRNNMPIWTAAAKVSDLVRAVLASGKDGLRPADYHLRAIDSLRWVIAESPAPPPELLADFDILLSDALVRLGYHIHFGKVDPATLDANWNLSLPVDGFHPVLHLEEAIAAKSVHRVIDEHKPQHPLYARLRAALAQYRAIEAAGGWPRIPDGPALKPGMADPRVPLVRKRLAVTGDHPPLAPADTGTVFDGALIAAVNRFQVRHQGQGDSSLGRRTLAQMNVPVKARIEQIRVDLERMRWVLHNLPDTLVLVNIASARVFYLVGGRNVWSTRAVVGKAGRESPIFADSIRYLVFNPVWTVPAGILGKDIIPAARRGVPVLRQKGLKVYDGRGRELKQSQIDWSLYGGNTFPYTVRQNPGANNALGRVKFMFPNRHAVYLHDTPAKDLFEKDVRLFSSGCIRIERPFELAALLLRDTVRWSAAAVDSLLRTKKETAVYLPRPVPVYLLYGTSSVTPDGRVVFADDVYRRNAALLKALDRPFRYEPRPVKAIREMLPSEE